MLALSPDSRYLYVTSQGSSTLSILDAASLTPLSSDRVEIPSLMAWLSARMGESMWHLLPHLWLMSLRRFAPFRDPLPGWFARLLVIGSPLDSGGGTAQGFSHLS